jgi:hypothetical protein
VEAIPVVTLNRDRGDTPVAVVPAGSGKWFDLDFYFPDIRSHHYSAKIKSKLGAASQTLRLPPSDGMGNFHLRCRRADFPPGNYILEIWDDAHVAPDGDEYAFEVR